MSDYQKADRICDLVMKGGITSGIVYPPAIDLIARRFWLCGIGGTSAGAIAAGLAAAAEYRRRHGSNAGYEALANLPNQISAPGRLLQLFKPDEATSPHFATFLSALDAKSVLAKIAIVPRALKLLMSPGLEPFVENGMGLCTGMGNGNPSPGHELPALTQWLSEQMDAFAGAGNGPLTFGQLWDAPRPPGMDDAMTGTRSISLQLISTCLTFGRPYALPFLDKGFLFKPSEFKRFFPPNVMTYLLKAADECEQELREKPPQGYRALPVEGRLPVIVAVRMSLSFPVLFSLVPLHRRNREKEGHPVEPVYFADGGITSNLPIHFFDSPFPRWPTLAINLQYSKKAGQKIRKQQGDDGIYFAPDRRSGVAELFNQFLVGSPLKKIAGLIGAIFNSAQTWTDNSFLKLPGYRDRVAEICLDPNEGGMNLNMPTEVILTLVKKGRAAGEKLVQRFADVPPADRMSWDGHRWVRFRSSMPALVEYLQALRRSVSHPMPGDRKLFELLSKVDAVPDSYRLTEEQRVEVVDAVSRLLKLADDLEQSSVCPQTPKTRPFCNGPRPPMVLQGRASLTDPGPEQPAPEMSPTLASPDSWQSSDRMATGPT